MEGRNSRRGEKEGPSHVADVRQCSLQCVTGFTSSQFNQLVP